MRRSRNWGVSTLLTDYWMKFIDSSDDKLLINTPSLTLE
jgi:hypothetical protein